MLTAFQLVLAVVLVLLNGFFVAAEFAIVKVRATRIQQLVEEGHGRAKVAQIVVTKLDEHLSATQLGITLASLALGWIGEPAVADLLEHPFALLGQWIPALDQPWVVHTASFVIGFSIITILHIVLGELVPKSMAIAQAETITLWCAAPLRWFYTLFKGPIWVLNSCANAILRRMGFEPASEKELAHSGEELRMIVSASAAGGHLDETERAIIDNVFEFSERIAREIMVPRSEMLCLFTDDPWSENLQTALEAGHTRFPLCEEDKDNIIGMIHLRDLFRAGGEVDLRTIMRPVMMVPETVSVSRLLKEFQRQKSQMAVLVDEYGGTAGLVTLEDLVEEIVGDIPDEFGEEEPEVKSIGPDTFEVDGSMLLADAEEQLDLDIEETEGIDTIGGYVLFVLASRPQVGQSIKVGRHTLAVTEVEGFRVTRLRITLNPTAETA